jgi:hypothetical protein
MDAELNIASYKTQSDYDALYVTRLGDEITKEKAKLAAASGEDEDVLKAESTAVIAWFQEKLDARKILAADSKAIYVEVRGNRDQEVKRQQKRLEIQLEQNALSVTWNKIGSQQFVYDLITGWVTDEVNVDAISEDDKKAFEKYMTKLSKGIEKAQSSAENAQQLLDKKRNALERQIENQDFARDLNETKKNLVFVQKELTEGQAQLVKWNEQLSKEVDPLKVGDLKIEISILGLNIDTWKTEITTMNANIADLDSQNKTRQEEQALADAIE